METEIVHGMRTHQMFISCYITMNSLANNSTAVKSVVRLLNIITHQLTLLHKHVHLFLPYMPLKNKTKQNKKTTTTTTTTTN